MNNTPKAKFDTHKTMMRFMAFAIIFTLVGVAIVSKTAYTMTVKKEYWERVNAKKERDSLEVPAQRGSILSDNGQQLATNLPEYRIYMDFRALQEGKADTLWHDSLGNDTPVLNHLCESLHNIFPDKTAAEFKEHLKRGYDKGSRWWPVVHRRIDYTTFQKVRKLPIFRLKSGIGGFTWEEFMVRNRPYGSLASSVIGSTYKEKGVAYSGLELAYDSILRGTPGYKHRRKVLNAWVDVVDSASINGCDIVTTIDVGIQDLAERALIKEMKKDNAYTGVAIVMDVKTGDVKAMVNMDRNPVTGIYEEGRNHAIADVLEPGSVFKTASFMVALDDGVIDTTDHVDTGSGIMPMYGSKMRDHNWHRGGYGVISVPRVLQVSSNIGVSYLIDKNYHHQPEKFVEGLHRIGIGENLHLPFPEYHAPRIRMPKKNKRGQWLNWSNTALPWMSIGYETGVPPISVLTFYNGIANNGVMVKPRFVTRIERDGVTVKEYPVEVLRRQMCSPEALGKIQTMLEQVVSIGLGKTAGVKGVRVSGKTGTAQKADGHGYKSGTVNYLLSFAGYFPSDRPQYSCIVCIHKAGLPASGGLMSGQVFHDIAEGVLAKNIKYDVKNSGDSVSVHVPDVKTGNIRAADYVLHNLGFNPQGGWNGAYAMGKPVWGRAENTASTVKIEKTTVTARHIMPDVMGMGARDAVYMLESRGAKVVLQGRGKVRHQSKKAGTVIQKGEKIILELS